MSLSTKDIARLRKLTRRESIKKKFPPLFPLDRSRSQRARDRRELAERLTDAFTRGELSRLEYLICRNLHRWGDWETGVLDWSIEEWCHELRIPTALRIRERRKDRGNKVDRMPTQLRRALGKLAKKGLAKREQLRARNDEDLVHESRAWLTGMWVLVKLVFDAKSFDRAFNKWKRGTPSRSDESGRPTRSDESGSSPTKSASLKSGSIPPLLNPVKRGGPKADAPSAPVVTAASPRENAESALPTRHSSAGAGPRTEPVTPSPRMGREAFREPLSCQPPARPAHVFTLGVRRELLDLAKSIPVAEAKRLRCDSAVLFPTLVNQFKREGFSVEELRLAILGLLRGTGDAAALRREPNPFGVMFAKRANVQICIAEGRIHDDAPVCRVVPPTAPAVEPAELPEPPPSHEELVRELSALPIPKAIAPSPLRLTPREFAAKRDREFARLRAEGGDDAT